MNLLCGLVAVVFVFAGDSGTAFALMLAAAIFDLCDGLAARALGAFSPIGGELDSLSDMVSFGVLPSLMLHRLMRDSGAPSALCFIPLVLAVFSALRLAKFNVDERQHESFLGLATPACAIFCGVLYAGSDEVHQLFVDGRACRAGDVLIDAAGVFLGVLIAHFARKNKQKSL